MPPRRRSRGTCFGPISARKRRHDNNFIIPAGAGGATAP
jgi:hypothetical protein